MCSIQVLEVSEAAGMIACRRRGRRCWTDGKNKRTSHVHERDHAQNHHHIRSLSPQNGYGDKRTPHILEQNKQRSDIPKGCAARMKLFVTPETRQGHGMAGWHELRRNGSKRMGCLTRSKLGTTTGATLSLALTPSGLESGHTHSLPWTTFVGITVAQALCATYVRVCVCVCLCVLCLLLVSTALTG